MTMKRRGSGSVHTCARGSWGWERAPGAGLWASVLTLGAGVQPESEVVTGPQACAEIDTASCPNLQKVTAGPQGAGRN